MDAYVSTMQRPLKRAEAKAQTRSKVLQAAERLFLIVGYEAATIRDIAERAGMSTGAVFANFAGKEELFLAVLEEEDARLEEMLGQPLPCGAPFEDVETTLGRIIDYYGDKARFLRDRLTARHSLDERLRMYFARNRSRLRERLALLIGGDPTRSLLVGEAIIALHDHVLAEMADELAGPSDAKVSLHRYLLLVHID